MSGMIISAYTRDNGYAVEAARLAASLDAVGVPYLLEAYDNRGSWVRNCAYKASFLLRMRDTVDGPLLWLDADARVAGDPWPYLAGLDCDIAAHKLGGHELISSTVYLNDTDACLGLLGRWVAAQETRPNVWDQKVLQATIEESPSAVRFAELPPELCWIEADRGGTAIDISERHYGKREPVIIQTQASRRLKH